MGGQGRWVDELTPHVRQTAYLWTKEPDAFFKIELLTTWIGCLGDVVTLFLKYVIPLPYLLALDW